MRAAVEIVFQNDNRVGASVADRLKRGAQRAAAHQCAPTVLHSGAVKLSAACAAIATFAAASITASLVQLAPEITSGFLAALSARAISLASGQSCSAGTAGERESSGWATANPGGRDHRVQRGTSR